MAVPEPYNEIVMVQVREVLEPGLWPRTVTARRWPVVETAEASHELIRWISRHGNQVAACQAELEHGYSPPSPTTAT